MELKKANHLNQLETFDFYLKKSLNELRKIQPKWACGKNISKILDYDLSPINNRYAIYSVKVKELIDNSIFNEVNLTKLFTGDVINDIRIARILARWDNNLFVDPPTIFFSNQHQDKLQFSDGRHRAKLTYLLGHDEISIAVANSDVNRISQILQLIYK